jgi:hypothetical protein
MAIVDLQQIMKVNEITFQLSSLTECCGQDICIPAWYSGGPVIDSYIKDSDSGFHGFLQYFQTNSGTVP